MGKFLDGCKIPTEDRVAFAKGASERDKTFYELCARKSICPVANECRRCLMIPHFDNIKSRIPVVIGQ